jgi:hypothetical protein
MTFNTHKYFRDLYLKENLNADIESLEFQYGEDSRLFYALVIHYKDKKNKRLRGIKEAEDFLLELGYKSSIPRKYLSGWGPQKIVDDLEKMGIKATHNDNIPI